MGTGKRNFKKKWHLKMHIARMRMAGAVKNMFKKEIFEISLRFQCGIGDLFLFHVLHLPLLTATTTIITTTTIRISRILRNTCVYLKTSFNIGLEGLVTPTFQDTVRNSTRNEK